MAKLIIATTREKIHQELCRGLEHAIKHGNVTKIMHDVEALPNGVTKSKATLWVEIYSHLRLASIKPIRFKKSNDANNNYDKAISSPYWEIKLPPSTNVKTNIKGELITCMHKFISDPSDTNHKALLQVAENYKLFGNSPVKKKMKTTPANLLQGGIPSLGGRN